MARLTPWLEDKVWSSRTIRVKPLSTIVVAAAYLGLGPIALLVAVALGFDWTSGKPTIHPAALLLFVLPFGAIVGFTWVWLQQRQSGETLTRLITLPGVIGGWLKADVECSLPPDPAVPVMIRLVNRTGKYLRKTWSMEQVLATAPMPVAGTTRSIVRVRLQVPRAPEQVPLELDPGFLRARTVWQVEIRKPDRGFDFFVKIPVPIYDTVHAPAAEQRPD